MRHPTSIAAVIPGRDELRRIADRALSFSTGDEARVSIQASARGNTRFAGGEITTSGGTTDQTVTVTSTIGRRRASATTNVLDDAGLRRAVELAERLARLAPEDPELMPELGPQEYASVDAFSPATAELSPEARALAVERTIAAARAEAGGTSGVDAASLFVAGFLDVNAGAARAVATSRGLFAYHADTGVDLSATVRTPDGTGSGWATTGARAWSDIDPAAIGRRAARKAIASRNPQAIEPGNYTVVLEPGAVAELIPLLAAALNARNADEGRSPFSKPGGGNRIGEKIVDERVTLLSDPGDPHLLARPFDNEGQPVERTVWIENGVLKGLSYSRFWAQKQGVRASGAGGFGFGGGGGSGGLKMLGGTKSVDELVAGTERGILITRLWYIRSLDQRTILNTGLTRDGTFLIERGRIVRPLKNFRWNESPLFMLNKLDELGAAERVSAGTVVPSMRVRDFTFTSLSDAV
jgi:predicted Zn-dependent protease